MPVDADSRKRSPLWKDRVAYAASPWYWSKPALVALVASDVLLCGLAVWFWVSGAEQRAAAIALALVPGWLLFLRPAKRSWRRWHNVRSGTTGEVASRDRG